MSRRALQSVGPPDDNLRPIARVGDSTRRAPRRARAATLMHPPAPESPPESPAPAGSRSVISLSEVLAALSYALDLTEGQRPGHTIRTSLVGMRMADELGLDAPTRSALHYALLLKDAGCSSNAARMCFLFGTDDQAVKPRMKVVDWHRKLGLALATWRNVGVGRSLADRLRIFAHIARTQDMTRELIQIRCERGADIARRLGFPEATAEAIRSLDEHWCGLGHPEGLRGDAIPLLARIANLAQTLEAFHADHGREAALRVVQARRGTWFDPSLVDLVSGWRDDTGWWRSLSAHDAAERLVALEPARLERTVADEGLDAVCLAFADIIDAKSPYTFHHSTNVAAYAVRTGDRLGLDADGLRRLRRAGLLHDIGKLGLSNAVLDKPGALTDDERALVRRHPRYSWEILSRVTAFRDFAWTAAVHHEKLDGSGYAWGVRGDQLDRPARVLAVADIYEALTADRPYRAGMAPEQALGILRKERGAQLCPDAVDALADVAGQAPAA